MAAEIIITTKYRDGVKISEGVKVKPPPPPLFYNPLFALIPIILWSMVMSGVFR